MKESRILSTSSISHEIENLIDHSLNFLIIVSPYLKITERLKAKLDESLNHIKNCFIIFKFNELRSEEKTWLSKYQNVHLIGVKNLHAKIYINEIKCLITSMNFYEYSQINNHEIGALFKEKDHKQEYERVIEEVLLMVKFSDKYDLLFSILEPFQDYTIGKLFNVLNKNSKKYNFLRGDEAYLKFCDDAMKIMQFKDYELYQDKSAILRRANIGKERYDEALKRLCQ
jgi:hypothetical protein